MAKSARRRRILVVNDTEEILELFRDLIESMGHECVTLTYAPDDLAHIRRVAPDIAIIDCVMGGMEFKGWQLVQKMKMSRDTSDIPIIICTGARNEVEEQEGWLTEKGVTIVLKPFDIEDLERAVERVLDQQPRARKRPSRRKRPEKSARRA